MEWGGPWTSYRSGNPALSSDWRGTREGEWVRGREMGGGEEVKILIPIIYKVIKIIRGKNTIKKKECKRQR